MVCNRNWKITNMFDKKIYKAFLKSWWVVTFILLCTILYEQGMHRRDVQFQLLQEQLTTLQLEKQQSIHKQQNLEMQINSQSDLAWIELALMKGLGVIPEDYQKIYFEN